MAVSDRKLTAADVMTASPRTCSTYSTVMEAAMIFRDADCGAVPVLDDGKVVGLLTDRDVALALVEKGPELGMLPVADLMTQGVITVGPTESLETVVQRFADRGIRRLLVVEGDQLLGIIGWADLVGYVSDRDFGQIVSEVVDQS